MGYRFEFRPYRRKFKRPLQTSHGSWEFREGIILRLTDEKGKVGLGEIAPLSWFGSETFDRALDFCTQLPEKITATTIFSIPRDLPACQFGIESAWEACCTQLSDRSLDEESEIENPKLQTLTHSGLLPVGQAALVARQILWFKGYRTFKWKIGVAPIEEELRIFKQLVKSIEEACQQEPALLRLDANGGLDYPQAQQWLEACEDVGPIIEFLEQPLATDKFEAMLELSDRYSIPIALDESVATLDQMQAAYRNGWQGIFVVKPSIAGSPSEVRQFCQLNQIDTVFSSVFESKIGRKAALSFAADIHTPRQRAVGFGITHWFEEDDETLLMRVWKDL